MSIELYFSNQLERLGEKLSANILQENKKKENILLPSTIIAPNSSLKKWLQMVIAGHLGIAINLKFDFPEYGLWKMVSSLDKSGERIEFLDKETLQLFILYLFQDTSMDCNEIQPIQNYLVDKDNQRSPDFVRRLWQISERLSLYFKEYELHRPEMIKLWQKEDWKHDKPPDMELCQKVVYNKLFNTVDGLCSNINGKAFMTLPQYAYNVFNHIQNPKSKIQNPKSIHIFGLSQVSVFHQYLISKLGEYFDVYIYAFNPCCEFWEDVETPGEHKWRVMKSAKSLKISDEEDDEGELKESDNLLLEWWGKPGRENIRLLSELTDYNFNELFCLNEAVDAEQDSMLQRLQRHILFRTPSGDDKTLPVSQDCSLQIVACPGKYREVETIYNSIIYNMEQDKSLKLTDIAILVPDMGKYKTAVTSVFNRNPRHISYNLVDSTAEKESVFGQAVIGILKLADGSFSRKEVFTLIFNPCFLHKFRLGRNEVQVWVKWADQLNIFHGFDGADKKRRGYSGNAIHTWQHGLRRMRLARIMNLPKDAEVSGKFKDYRGVTPFEITYDGDPDLLEKFCMVIESLFVKIQPLRYENCSCKIWAGRINAMINEFLEIPDDYSQEELVRQSLFENLNNLEIYDELMNKGLLSGGHAAKELRCFDLAMITEFIKTRLMLIPSSYGSYLTGGVTVSEMQPMRPVPFKIVYVLGLGEGEFPGRISRTNLDLRLLKRKIGDISRPETNRYMFLEILVSTRNKLYLTYVSKDLQKDEEYLPCSVIHQLRQYIERYILIDSESFEIAKIPLKGADVDYLKIGMSKASDVMVNYSDADRLSCYIENNMLDNVKAVMDKDELKRLKRYEPDFRAKYIDVKPEPEIEKITIRKLKRFLEDPASASLKRNLCLYDDEMEDKSIAENEPFYSGFPLDYNLIIRSMEHSVKSSSTKSKEDIQNRALNYFKEYYKHSMFKGQTPENGFSDLDGRKFEKTLNDRFPQLVNVLEKTGQCSIWYNRILIGEGSLQDLIERKNEDIKGNLAEYNPLSIEINLETNNSDSGHQKNQKNVICVEIHGSLPMTWRNNEGWNVLVFTTRKKSDSKLPEKYALEPFLFYITALAGDETVNHFKDLPFTIHVLYTDECKSWSYNIEPKAAKEYLYMLVSDYLNKYRFDLLPFSQVSKAYYPYINDADRAVSGIDKPIFKEEVEELITSNEELTELVKLSGAKVPDDAFDVINRRFAIYYKGLSQ